MTNRTSRTTLQRNGASWRRGRTILVALAVAAVLGPALARMERLGADEPAPALPERDRYLLLDARVVERSENAVLRVGAVEKHPANPLLQTAEFPFEEYTDNLYPNVLYDAEEGVYKCWYLSVLRGWGHNYRDDLGPQDKIGSGSLKMNYAVSEDGLEWSKPKMNLFTYQGEPTNVVAAGNHGTGIFKDPRDPDPERRYKMFTGMRHGTVAVAFSPDGFHWSDYQTVKTGDPLGNLRADTHNNAFWAPELEKYVGISRGWPDRIRTVVRMESADFVEWTDPVEVFRGPREAQTYSMPVFEYAGVYFGLASIYRETTDRRVHLKLTWSPDTVRWEAVERGREFIPLSPDPEAFDYGTVYAAATPIVGEDDIRIYYGATKERHTHLRLQSSLALATLRPDGWAGYVPDDASKPAVVTTVPIQCTGSTLTVTCDAHGGSVTVAVVDDSAKVLALSAPITTDVTDAAVRWQAAGGLKPFVGKRIRLRFEVVGAKLYSFGMVADTVDPVTPVP